MRDYGRVTSPNPKAQRSVLPAPDERSAPDDKAEIDAARRERARL